MDVGRITVRLTKYPQSCILFEHDDGGRLLIDPGSVAMDAMAFDAFGSVDAVLFTHRHADHCDARAVAAIAERDVPVHANADVCGQIEVDASVVGDGQTFTAAGFEITAIDLPHVQMVDGSDGPPNTGFVLDGRVLHPGDAVQTRGTHVDVLAVPIAGPSVSFRASYVMVEQTGARTVVPIHYDVFLADPQLFAGFCDIARVVVLDHGDSTTV
jgi:L-ascorbate metabolism protein UlaG (beta-lactamase superfamily)